MRAIKSLLSGSLFQIVLPTLKIILISRYSDICCSLAMEFEGFLFEKENKKSGSPYSIRFYGQKATSPQMKTAWEMKAFAIPH